MKMYRRRAALVSLASVTVFAASNAFAAADPNAPQPDPNGTVVTQDPNAQPQGTVVMQGDVAMAPQQQQQPPQQQQQQQQQPPPDDEPPPRRSLLIGAAPSFSVPLIGRYAMGGAYGGGLNAHIGYAFGNLSLAFAPGLFYYRGRAADELVFSLGAFIRYTFLRDVIIHPFVEVGLDYWGPITTPGLSGRAFGVGASGAIGAEYDVTDHISLQLAARITGIAGPQASEVWVGDLVLTPFVAFAYYR